MNFNSIGFLIFFPVVVLVYWRLPFRFRWAWLLAASWYFYMSWNAAFIFLILMTTGITYISAWRIEACAGSSRKKFWLFLALSICLGELIFFKYFNFLLNSVVSALNLFSLHIEPVSFNILLPVGISFYTFQALSYVLDVYRGKAPAEKHFGYYAVFVSYFPQLVAGPIERTGDLLTQLRKEQHLCSEDMAAGLRLMLCGFFRKCVIADTFGIYVTPVFENLERATSLAIFIAGAMFCIQMYCDFAGYSEIARGAARTMGIRLTRNFNRPYLSLSYSEFFRRWHITLSRWFTDYLYIPLGGNRRGTARKIFNTVVVFFLCGLWHGASWNYVLWGLYAAFFICLESIASKPAVSYCEKHRINTDSTMIRLLRRSLMFFIFVPAALIFRAEGLQKAITAVAGLFTRWGRGADYLKASFEISGIRGEDALLIMLCLVCTGLVFYMEQYERTKDTAYGWRVAAYFFSAAAVALSWLLLAAGGDVSAFAYFQF